MSKSRIILTVSTIGVIGLSLWHRATVRKERQRAVSDDRQRQQSTPKAA